MSKSIGKFTITLSEKAEIDKQALISALNNFKWSNSITLFEVNGDGSQIKLVDEGWCDEPSIFPERIKSLEIYNPKNPDETYSISPDVATADDLANIEDFQSEVASLEDICIKVSPAIKSGHITLSCTADGTNSLYSYHQTLKIYHDGSGHQDYVFTDHQDGSKSVSKSFECRPQLA